MPSIDQIKASDGSGNANVATVQNSRSPGSSTIIVDTVLGINVDGFSGSMGTPHTFTDPITSETITVISEATAVDFTGHVDGANLEIDDIAPGYTDIGSEVGDIVIIRPTTQWGDNVAEVLEVSHNDDGTLNDAALAQIYPVGSIYIATVATNPATLLGFGTWVAYAAGRVLVGVGTSDQAFAAAATGGESTHVLTTPEIPSHTHDTNLKGDGGSNTNAHEIVNNLANNASPRISAPTGGGGAHNNLQPYIVVYMWNRTA